MGLLNRIKMLWQAAVGSSYSWPALDITLPGERYLHLVGSIHMGTRDMSPPPARLLKKIRQADAQPAAVAGGDGIAGDSGAKIRAKSRLRH